MKDKGQYQVQIEKAIKQIELTQDLIERLARIHALALQHREERLKKTGGELTPVVL